MTFASASWYEKTELVITPLHPWVQIMQPMVDPPGIARPELWDVQGACMPHRPVRCRHVPEFEPEEAEEAAAEEVLRTLLENGGETIDHITVEDLKAGPCKLAHSNPGEKKIPFWRADPRRSAVPHCLAPQCARCDGRKFVKSGRIEFYKDEDRFLEMGEQLPCYKPAFEDTEYAADPKRARSTRSHT